jgi:hypothetical protein
MTRFEGLVGPRGGTPIPFQAVTGERQVSREKVESYSGSPAASRGNHRVCIVTLNPLF